MWSVTRCVHLWSLPLFCLVCHCHGCVVWCSFLYRLFIKESGILCFSAHEKFNTIFSFSSRSTYRKITFQILTSFKQSYIPAICQDVDEGIEIGAWIWSTKENGRCKMAVQPVVINSMVDLYCHSLVLYKYGSNSGNKQLNPSFYRAW